MNTLSVIIITYNEESQIKRTLESVRFAHEIIVLDSGSTDNTVAICQQFTPSVFVDDWPGFGPQKNRALSHAKCDWILSIDADEIVSAELAREIQQITQQESQFAAYAIPRRSSYLGQQIRFGDWRNDKPIRLFKRGLAKFSDDAVHERLEVTGKTGQCQQFIHHEAFKNLEEVLHKVNLYSSLSAKMKNEKGKRGGLTKAIIHGSWTFIRGYIFRLGFLDGKAGFMLAVSNAEGCYYRYLKLLFLTSSP